MLTARPLRIRLGVTLGALLVVVSCVKPDTTQLSPTGQQEYTAVQFVRAVNDASTAVITANTAGKVSDTVTARVLTVNKQLLDVVEANPQTWQSGARVALKNALDALPTDQRTSVQSYLLAVSGILGGT